MSTATVRNATLMKMCGLVVRAYRRKGVRYFVFAPHAGSDIKTVCTYKKARIFAEGYKAGFQAGRTT